MWCCGGLALQEAEERCSVYNGGGAYCSFAGTLGIAELLSEIGLKVVIPYKLNVDNQAAIKQIEREDTPERAKHIDIRYKFTKGLTREKGLAVAYCESKSMRADILTKIMPTPRLEELRPLVMLTPWRARARKSVGIAGG
jgi:hypothetical protein